MSSINIINNLQIIENIMGVYRNFNLLDGKIKPLIQLRIIVEICVAFLAFLYVFNTLIVKFSYDNRNYFTYVFELYYISFEFINSFTAIVLGYRYCKYFEEFFLNISAIHNAHETDSLYSNIAKRQYKRFCVDVTIFSVAFVIMIFIYAVDWIGIIELSIFSTIHFTAGTIHQCRFFCESFVFHQFIEIVICQLNYINESVTKTITNLENEDSDCEGSHQIQSQQEKWSEGCHRLLVSCNCLQNFFGIQVNVLD